MTIQSTRIMVAVDIWKITSAKISQLGPWKLTLPKWKLVFQTRIIFQPAAGR